MMKFRNDAEKAAWIAWTHDAVHLPRQLGFMHPDNAVEYADAMLEAMRLRETKESE